MRTSSHFVITTEVAVGISSTPRATSAYTAVTLCKALSKALIPSATIDTTGAIIRNLFAFVVVSDHFYFLSVCDCTGNRR